MRRNLSILTFLFLLLVTPIAAFADSIAGMSSADRDYTIEGDVVTVWDDSFLLNDGSGQVIVDIRPHTTHELKIAGRGYVLLSGRMAGEVFKPLVLSKPDGTNTMFTGTDTLPPLPLTEVMRNTERHRFNPPSVKKVDTKTAPSSGHAQPKNKEEQPKTTSSAQPEVQPQQPVEPAH